MIDEEKGDNIMSIQLNEYILPDSIIDKMKRFSRLSNETKEDSCFSLCTNNSDNNIIIDRNPHKGKKCTSIIRPKCDENETPVGIFHSYPRRELIEPSNQDIRILYQYGIVCSISEKESICFSRKGDYNEDTNRQLLSIIERESKFNKKYRDILREYISTEFNKINVYKGSE